jgi:hypothetical protein
MINTSCKIKRGDLVRIQVDSNTRRAAAYGVVVSCSAFRDQLSLFPIVKVYTFSGCTEKEYYPYNLEIVSAI